jgi:hypothetical protein
MKTVVPSERDWRRAAYWREHGSVLLLLAAGLLWLTASMVEWAPQHEVVSWSAFGVAVAVGLLGPTRRLSGWRLRCVGGLAGVLLALGVWLGFGWLGSPARATTSDQPPATYREARGSDACSSRGCSGHEAGWQWARERGIRDPDSCGGRSLSFVEGCRAWAQEQ